MKLNNIIEKVEFLNSYKSELDQVLVEMENVLKVDINSRSTTDRYDYLQQILNKAVAIRRIVNSFNAKVPDIQEDIRDLITEIEDQASLEE